MTTSHPFSYPQDRRTRLITGLTVTLVALLLAISIPAIRAQDKPVEIRIGYQRGGVWTLLKNRQLLEARFGPNVTTTWTLFPAGPQLLEALNVGAIDLGSTGDTPPIFAQAAGTPLVYVSYQEGNGAGSAVIVPEGSPIKTVEDLKGKKVSFQKASSSHLLIVRALEKFGLTYADIEPVFLAPADARAAFQGGSIDAWVIWNPFLEAAKQELNAQVLADGAEISPTKGYTLASRTFVDEHPDLVLGVIEELKAAQDWAYANRDEYAQIQSEETGLDVSIWRNSFQTDAPQIYFIDEDAIAYQQNVADIFYELGLIPAPLVITDVVWIGGENPEPEATAETTLEATAEATTQP
jgi:sulfonate transport system substrate-binding protein